MSTVPADIALFLRQVHRLANRDTEADPEWDFIPRPKFILPSELSYLYRFVYTDTTFQRASTTVIKSRFLTQPLLLLRSRPLQNFGSRIPVLSKRPLPARRLRRAVAVVSSRCSRTTSETMTFLWRPNPRRKFPSASSLVESYTDGFCLSAKTQSPVAAGSKPPKKRAAASQDVHSISDDDEDVRPPPSKKKKTTSVSIEYPPGVKKAKASGKDNAVRLLLP